MDVHQRALGKWTYYYEFFLTPLVVGAALWWSRREVGPAWATAVAVGFCVWTLFEYCLHRWYMHGPYSRMHAIHHVRPLELQSIPSWVTTIGQILIGVAAIALGGRTWGAGGFAGFMAGYYLNMAAHDAFHRRRRGFLARLFARSMRRHDVHHRGVEANFGLCFGIWDRLFGTYQEGLRHRA